MTACLWLEVLTSENIHDFNQALVRGEIAKLSAQSLGCDTPHRRDDGQNL